MKNGPTPNSHSSKKIGWKGQVYGPDSGVYRVGPLGRLNASDGMATPLAQAEYEVMYKTLGGKPVHGTLAFHWARLIELLYATERALELVKDPEITSTNVRNKPGEPSEGVGIVEAARGTLIHHYTLDKDALVKDVNLIVATTNNYPAICMSIRDAAKGLIHQGKCDQGVLNKVEMAFRAYDPCFGCATHYAVGQMPLTVKIYNNQKQLIQTSSGKLSTSTIPFFHILTAKYNRLQMTAILCKSIAHSTSLFLTLPFCIYQRNRRHSGPNFVLTSIMKASFQAVNQFEMLS